ncbi:DUF3237 domain-containing protein [Pseudarthrobacter sp. H2]|uniref:DUF3237 domain-containing protein n=1 Tax=Pseudarthrobacter sp. H2 TaxID=3418415 RepID=UPI003CEABA4E
MTTNHAAPDLSYLATFSIQVGTPLEVGETPDGFRRIIPILSGTVDGPGFKGSILSAGADFQLLRNPTLTELEAKYAVETSDGERIYVTNFGIRSGSAEDINKLVIGEPVDPKRIYFRCAPRLTSTGKNWAWLNSRIFIATGERLPDEVRLDVFTVN